MGCCTGYTFTSAPDAALDPNQRVNFTFGMVLGVDDFRQEHAYLGARDERALRALIGYGAISGLDVDTVVTGGQVAVRVTPGLALLPDGKLVGVKAAQCARLDEWLAGPGKPEPGRTGKASVYVVLRHAEVTGTPVPIPGEPCRDESALLADSRIADSYTLDFSWTAPAQAEDDALRTFAAWLRRVDILPTGGTPLDAFLAAVEAQVTAAIAHAAPAFAAPPLAATPLPDPDPAGAQLIIPRDQYTTYINAAFDVWVRRLRAAALAPFGPVPAADPAHAAADAGLLLAALDLELNAGNLVFPPAPGQPAVARWLGRAQLVHLQMLQQWLISSSATDAPVGADYVLGRADPHLPNAQDLLADFALTDHALARIDLVAAPLPGNPDARKAVLRPAVKWPGGAGEDGGPDYYGPAMTAPIPVGDGGTGQSDAPVLGQLLVGVAGTEDLPAHFSLGDLLPVERPQEGDTAALANLTVDVTSAAPDILIDTIQDIGPQDSPQFAGLTVDGALTAGALTLDTPLSTSSGGTGQNAVPADGQLLVGVAGTGEDPARFALGDLRAVTRFVDSGADMHANLTVDVTSAAPDILIDTIQGIGPLDSPQFAGLAIDGEAMAAALTLATPLPIASGGTGQAALPQRLQVLVGEREGDGGDFVLARLADSDTVSVTLQRMDRQDDWRIQFDALSSGIVLPLAVDQGGTGLSANTSPGQILLGDDAGTFGLGGVRPATEGRHIAVALDGPDLTIDTTPQTHWATRIVGDTRDALKEDDHVVLLVAASDGVVFALGDPEDERVVIIKTASRATFAELVRKERGDSNEFIDNAPSVRLGAFQSVTLIGNSKLARWFVIGRT
ncbi:hypothetical protein [Massilia sp. S19_KUP03_FR1]|uniref:hypothetical protein n=1 Tax=Massilia sp. S19_KUP03_FR1 TaxID=3025503 RepID=UPI002FCD6D4C